MLGNVYLYLNEEDAEEKAIHHYNEARKIIENLLSERMNLHLDKVDFFTQTSLFGLDRDFIKREHLVVSDKDDLDVVEFKQILTNIYDKIEDTFVQQSQKNLLMKEKETLKNGFGDTFKPVSENVSGQVKNLGSFGNACKTQEENVINLGTFGSANKLQNKSDEEGISTAEKDSDTKMTTIIKRKLEILPGNFNGEETKKIVKPE